MIIIKLSDVSGALMPLIWSPCKNKQATHWKYKHIRKEMQRQSQKLMAHLPTVEIGVPRIHLLVTWMCTLAFHFPELKENMLLLLHQHSLKRLTKEKAQHNVCIPKGPKYIDPATTLPTIQFDFQVWVYSFWLKTQK